MTVEFTQGPTPAGGVRVRAFYCDLETWQERNKDEATAVILTELDAQGGVIAETIGKLKPKPDVPPLDVVEAQIGYGLDGYYVVRAPGDGSLAWSFTVGRQTEAESFEPPPAGWERFWAVVDRLDVWGWAESYETLDVMDGTYWSITLERATGACAHRATTATPTATGLAPAATSAPSAGPSPAWQGANLRVAWAAWTRS